MLLYLYSEADETFMQMNISKRLIGDFALYSVNFLRNFYNELNSCNLQMAITPTVGFPFTTAYRSRPSFRLTTYRDLVVSVEIPHAPPDQLHGYIQFKIARRPYFAGRRYSWLIRRRSTQDASFLLWPRWYTLN